MQKKGKESPNFIDKKGHKVITNQGCQCEIIEYFNALNSTVLFSDGTVIKNVNYSAFKKGEIKNPNHPSVYNIGFEGIGKFTSVLHPNTYRVWTSMLYRCTDIYGKRFPTYKEVTVCEEWKCFQNFAQWFEENWKPWMDSSKWQLDKDILVKGNKIYSSETCCFVPSEINYIFSKKKSCRGNYPMGVSKVGKKFQTSTSINGKQVYLGLFNTPEKAFEAYKIAKENYIKEMANKWKNQITEQTYRTMYNYKIEITD